MSGSGERRLGAFRVEGGLGRSGSQGSVYRAVCAEAFPGVAVGETVALKTMPAGDGPESQSRFERRVAAIAEIRDDHVVRYRGSFTASGPFQSQHVTVMDWLEGETLKDLLGREPSGLDADVALKIVDGLLAGLAAAQSAGLVHRDVKPGNVFLCRDGSVKLIDFEVSRRAQSATHSSSGGFAGTFDYMAPEFADPEFSGTFASDVFAVGVVLHEALTGQVPYARKTEQGEQADFAFLSRWSQRKEGLCAIRIKSSVKRVLSHADEVLLKALAENPAERYPDAASFRAALRTIRYREVRSATDAYRLLRIVGEGGFGCVYRARARGAGRFVAVKQLKRPEFGDRFRREAQVMRRLDDPAFVRLVDYFETREVGAVGAFLVMDFLPGMPGSSLRDAIRRAAGAPLPFNDVVRAFERYARALALMHRLRIYHRDIKPSNLYFPSGDPSRAAIMDLGIARDVSGTATQGQVPGTLDYMPPEVVLGGSRGDAGMDIYALGLCLYEAVSGKTGYPRLPTGSRAFSAFYERARARCPPTFDAPLLRERPQLLALLREMTALDPHARLQDAEVLRRRLMLVGAEVPGVASAEAATSVSVSPPTEDAPTGETAGGAPQHRASVPGVTWLCALPRKWVFGIVVAVAAAAAVAVGWNPLVRSIAAVRSWHAGRTVQKVVAEREAVAARERQQATAEARAVLAAFSSNAVTAVAADAAASRWLLHWRKNENVASLCQQMQAEFAQALRDRRMRDAAEAEVTRLRNARREQQDVVSALQGTNVTFAACTNRVEAWKGKWLGAIDPDAYSGLERELSAKVGERKNRDAQDAWMRQQHEQQQQQRQKAAIKAVAAAARVEANYADMDMALDVVDGSYAQWRTQWRTVLDLPAVAEAANRVAAARKRRAGWEGGEQVVTECNRHLDNILLVGPEDVKNWYDLVRQAELALMKAEMIGGVSPEQSAAVRARIAACRRWIVGVIDNKTDRPIDFAGRTVGPVTAVTLVFTNGYPAGAAVRSAGCEPLHVREERFSARVFTVMPRDLEERACETKAVLSAFPSGILCFIDGIERKAGEILLRRGQHAVRYCRQDETYPGVKDYEMKEYAFETRLSGAVEVPAPTGEWVLSAAFRQAREQSALVARGKAIEADCRRLLEPLPVETRRKRLEDAHALLCDWKTSSALGVLGVGVEKALRAAYEAECARVRGYVKNATAHAASVITDGEPVAVPAGQKALVTYERGWPPDAHAVVAGYEFVMLPLEASAFDGKLFEIRAEKLVPLPVRVDVPTAEDDVTCVVDGAAAAGAVRLRPGEHEAVWTKPDHVPQRFPFVVLLGVPRSVPTPGKWKPTGALSGLAEAFRAFNGGAVDAAKRLSDGIGDIEDPARRQELEELKRAIELRKKLEGQNP